MFITANGTYAQPGEESLFTEKSWSTPRESTRFQDSSHSSVSTKHLPSNYLPWCIVLRMTNIPNFINESGWRDRSSDRWWRQCGHRRVHVLTQHRRRQFGSSTESPTSRSGTPGEVLTYYKGSTAKETELWRYGHCRVSASEFPQSTCGNGITTAQIRKVIPPQRIILVWPCTIRPDSGASQQV